MHPFEDPQLGSSFSGLLSSMTPILTTGGVLFGGVLVAMGVFSLLSARLNQREADGAVPLMFGGVLLMAASGFVLPWILDSSDASTAPLAPQPTPTSTPSPAATTTPVPVDTAPATAPEPADLTGFLIALCVIAGLVGLLVLTLLVIHAIRRVRTARAEAAASREYRQRIEHAWQGVHDHHDELLRKILHAETDWDALFFTPALSDPNVPQTYEMLLAMRAANTLRDTAGHLPRSIKADIDITKLPYARAITEFAMAWDAAERHARRVGQTGIPHAERKKLKQIRTYLDIAENSAASPTERALAYRGAQSLLKQLETVHIPTKVLAQLEEQHRLMLTARA